VTEIFFAHPHTLLEQVHTVLKKVGSDRFFISPDEEVKKAREGFAAYFFSLAMKKNTGKDWWLAQYDQVERAYPDFDFISLGETPEKLVVESVELTGVYPHFKLFDEVMGVVEKKQKQYGFEPVKFSLLVFVNHEKSEEWTALLRERLKTEHPFLSVWTIHLRFKKGGKEVGKIVAQRIRPLPGLRIEADTDDKEIYKTQSLPYYTEEVKNGDRISIKIKSDFISQFGNKS